MTQDTVIDLVRNAIMTILITSAPLLLLGLIVGVLVSIFQTVTSIQEQTLAFVPKIVAVFLGLLLFGAFMLTTLSEYIINLYQSFPELINPR